MYLELLLFRFIISFKKRNLCSIALILLVFKIIVDVYDSKALQLDTIDL